jgi:hypothetical protein
MNLKKVNPEMGDNYRGVLEECMTDDEKVKFKEAWDNLDDKSKKLRMRNIWKFMKQADISMNTVRKIRRRVGKK